MHFVRLAKVRVDLGILGVLLVTVRNGDVNHLGTDDMTSVGGKGNVITHVSQYTIRTASR